jgi:hypothetical protein
MNTELCTHDFLTIRNLQLLQKLQYWLQENSTHEK